MKTKKNIIKKTSKKKTSKKQSPIQEEIQEIEQWIIERKKFLIKLAWTTALILALVIISNLYLKTAGVGA